MIEAQSAATDRFADLRGDRHEEPEETAFLVEQSSLADLARIVDLEQELAKTRDQWMRAEAENANVRSRAKRDVDEAKQFAMQRFATEVVEAADNLHRGLDSVPSTGGSEPGLMMQIRDGYAGVERSFVAMLERNGIKRIDPTGAAFDAASHQAMGEQDSSIHPPGTVLRALTPAWTLNGRLLRPAMVIVAKHP